MVFIVSKKEGPNGLLLVVTDKEIIGKQFTEEKLQLDLSKEFYQGEEMEKEKISKKLKIDLNLRPQNLNFETFYNLTREYENLRG